MYDKNKRCICCGSTNEDTITRHHVFPLCYFKYIPKDCNIDNNVVNICLKCHRKYERKALDFKKEIAFEYNLNINDYGKISARILSLSKALVKHNKKIPLKIKIRMGKEVRRYFGYKISRKILVSFLNDAEKDEVPFGKTIVQKKMESGELIKFANEWKKHFVSVMRLKNLEI